jgi:O-acetyl-ADP-ribose deacetylase (regulator of RNase III)
MEAVNLGVSSITFPGLGTGTGDMSSVDCAKQVNAAINDVFINKRAYKGPTDLYEELDYMRKHIVSEKWMRVQHVA